MARDRGPRLTTLPRVQQDNNRAASLARGVDMVFPSLYTFYPDQAGWLSFAAAQVCEARRLSSGPVYVFLWPEYHPGSSSGGEAISPDYWRFQLETARRLADGIVIWGGLRSGQSPVEELGPQCRLVAGDAAVHALAGPVRPGPESGREAARAAPKNAPARHSQRAEAA
jgi:hypothetical protein